MSTKLVQLVEAGVPGADVPEQPAAEHAKTTASEKAMDLTMTLFLARRKRNRFLTADCGRRGAVTLTTGTRARESAEPRAGSPWGLSRRLVVLMTECSLVLGASATIFEAFARYGSILADYVLDVRGRSTLWTRHSCRALVAATVCRAA